MNTLAPLGNASAFPLDDTQVKCYEKVHSDYSISLDPYLIPDTLHDYDKIPVFLAENEYEEAFTLATSNEDLYLMKYIYEKEETYERLQEILYLSCQRDNLKLVKWCLDNDAEVTQEVIEIAKWSSRDSIVKLLKGGDDLINIIGEWVLQQL